MRGDGDSMAARAVCGQDVWLAEAVQGVRRQVLATWPRQAVELLMACGWRGANRRVAQFRDDADDLLHGMARTLRTRTEGDAGHGANYRFVGLDGSRQITATSRTGLRHLLCRSLVDCVWLCIVSEAASQLPPQGALGLRDRLMTVALRLLGSDINGESGRGEAL